MSPAPAQLQFSVQFASFLVAAAGLALVLLRAELLVRKSSDGVILSLGFASLAAAAFLNGSLAVPSVTDPVVVGVRVAGLALLAVGSLGRRRAGGGNDPPDHQAHPRASPPARLLVLTKAALWLGVALQGAAVVASFSVPVTAAILLGAGAASIGGALAFSSRRSVAGRVTASAGGTLLVLVLVLSVALSVVLSSTVHNDAVSRVQIQAGAVTSQLKDFTNGLGSTAVLLGSVVRGVCPGTTDACTAANVPGLITSLFPDVGVAWIDPAGRVACKSPAPAPAPSCQLGLGGGIRAGALAASPVVQAALHATAASTEASAEVVGGRALAVAANPVGLPHLVGVAVVFAALDTRLVSAQVQDPSVSLALVSGGSVLARAGLQPPPPPSALAGIVRAALESTNTLNRTVSRQFVSVQAVNPPNLVLVAAIPTKTFDDTQDSLLRTLFVIALGGTLLALLLTSAVGDSVGTGLRRLTAAAEAIRRGERGVRADLRTGDELGSLGAAFDSMATSIAGQTAALSRAAEDEGRLRNRLEAVVAGMGEALVAVDHAGLVTDFNQAAEELTGIPVSMAMGQPLDEVVMLSADDGSDLSAQLRRPPAQRWSIQGWIRQGGGRDGAGLDKTVRSVPVAVSAGEVRGPGRASTGGVFVIRDLRREQEVERMKTEFLSRIGHELRTPLSGIMGFTYMLNRSEVSPEARAWSAEVLEQSKRLERTVQILEYFASWGADRVSLHRERLSAKSLVEEAKVRFAARANGRTIVCQVAQALPDLFADRRWITLALDELVDNAVKFSPPNGRVSIRAVAPTNASSVALSVADHGLGMSDEEVGAAFGDFVQADSSDTRHYGGLGLGLGLVRRVVESHGGQILCDSKPGQGTRVTMVLPVGVSEP